MKIFSAKQLREADKTTLKNQNIPSHELMERAGTLVFEYMHRNFQENKPPVKIFCGMGNNGGDGLVIARLMRENGYDVSVYIVNYSDKRSEGFLLNYQRLTDISEVWPVQLGPENFNTELKKGDFVIDAIFGMGLNKPLAPWVAQLIEQINKSGAVVLSIDIPSGMFLDLPKLENAAIIKADVTATFQAPKLPFYLPDTGNYVGNILIFDIGLDKKFLFETSTNAHLVEKQNVVEFYTPRERFSHKGTYGHVLLVGGSYGKMGSICLASRAALKSGAGMATAFVPKCGYAIVQTSLPEAMVLTDRNEEHLSEITFDFNPTVISFGVGAGKHQDTLRAFKKLLEGTKNPMLIDADGLNLLAENTELLKMLPKKSVLTPHPKELKHLLGPWENDFEKLKLAKRFSEKHEIVLVIKGAYTITVFHDQLYVNPTGNPGMATAGSGDVLSGVISGFMAQGYPPLRAAIFGVYLHGLAGDIAARKVGAQSLIAGMIGAHLGKAFLSLFSAPATPKQKKNEEKQS